MKLSWNQIELVVAQHDGRPKCHCIVHLKIVKCIFCEFHFSYKRMSRMLWKR